MCASSGGGIGSDSYFKGIGNDVTGNVVHDVGPAGCAYFLGIYINTASSKVNNSHAGIRMRHDATHGVIANNTVCNSAIGVLVSGDGGYLSLSNNILYKNMRCGL